MFKQNVYPDEISKNFPTCFYERKELFPYVLFYI